MGILERIQDIEYEISRTQKNKATEYHIGRLKAQLAKLRSQLIEASASGGGKGDGFDVQKFGDARIALLGYPSVGKSTMLTVLTGVQSEVAAYEFTTLTCVPGVINYRNARLQLLDLPGIIEGAAQGRGRGRQVIAVARSSDLILMVLDATKDDTQRTKLEKELFDVGIRLNQDPPAIVIKPKAGGGLCFNATVPLTKMDEHLCQSILHTYKMFNCDVLFRGDYGADDLIDTIQGKCRYLQCIYVYNKVDMLSMEQLTELARRPYTVCISSSQEWNIDTLLEVIWCKLNLIRVYTKKPGCMPDFSDPLILTASRGGASVKNCVSLIHRSLVSTTKYATVWGKSVKHVPHQVSVDHILEDEDVIQICT